MMLDSGDSSGRQAAGHGGSAVRGYEGGDQPPAADDDDDAGHLHSIPRQSNLLAGSGLNHLAAGPPTARFRQVSPALPTTELPPPRRSGYANFAAFADEDAAGSGSGTDRFPDAFPECQPPPSASRAAADVPVQKRSVSSNPYRAGYAAPKPAAAAAIGELGSGLCAAKPFTAPISSAPARTARTVLSFPDPAPQGSRLRREARIEPSFKTELHYKESLKDCIHEHVKVQLAGVSNILQQVSCAPRVLYPCVMCPGTITAQHYVIHLSLSSLVLH